MFDFWLPMILLFVAATVAAIAARRRRDRCLKFFHQRPATLLMGDGKRIWGKLNIYPKTLELVFEEPRPDENGLIKSSYVLYTPEVNAIEKVLQPPPSKGTAAYREWKEEIRRVANPSFSRRFRRGCWNIFNTLRDAVSQSIGMVLGTLKSKTPMGKVANADKRAGDIGNTLLGTVPNAYEPVLEKYLSKEVVVEMLEEGAVREFVGLLQEYSEKYILLRNVAYEADFLEGDDTPERVDIIFPRTKALVRHCLMPNKETET